MSKRILSILIPFLMAGVAILSISGTVYGDITYVRSNGTGLSTTTTLDIGTPGTDRLVVVFAGHESTGTNLTGVTVDTKACTLVTIADNPDGLGNHLEMWYIDEDGLGASTGTVTIAITGGDATWAVHAHLYTGVDQSGPTDSGIDNTSASTTTATVTGIDVPANGLVVMGSGEGQDGLTATWTAPLVERIDGGVADPSSGDMADASAVESTQQTNKTYVCTWSGVHNRATAIVAVWRVAVVCDYSYKRQITIDNTKVSGSADFTDFPALISLSGNWLKTTTADPTNGRIENASGYDIIFKASDGTTQLDHEIEEYDGTNGSLIAWVRIPTLDYNDDTVIYMYYGNPCIDSSTENVTGVWNSNYVGVWHLKENGNGSVDEYKDSTQYTNHGQGGEGDSLFVPTQVSGKISYG
ncbi:MAG: DUF2341 domain-containing protein, partial [Desulfobacteraceae bacterium]|nr:DUF2341 domain-containing protein [Desulfobacteraceae bacterium]